MEDNKKEPGGERPETLADIVREMRTILSVVPEGSGDVHIPKHWLEEWADCIEAASKQKRDPAPGNAAAMRCWLKMIRNMSEHNDNDLGNTAIRGLLDQLTRIHTCAREALAAPARNCDKYGDEDDAFAAWHDALNDGDAVSVRNAFKWLFATAEGGAE